MKNPNPHNVQVGQVWADNDKRGYGRTMTVTRVELSPPDREPYAEVESHGTLRYIKLRRFRPNSTGYRMVSAGSASPMNPERESDGARGKGGRPGVGPSDSPPSHDLGVTV